jgi:hypothetical protein
VSSTSVPKTPYDHNSTCVEDNEQRGEAQACQLISLLGFLEAENRDLRRAVVDLALETFLLKSVLDEA